MREVSGSIPDVSIMFFLFVKSMSSLDCGDVGMPQGTLYCILNYMRSRASNVVSRFNVHRLEGRSEDDRRVPFSNGSTLFNSHGVPGFKS